MKLQTYLSYFEQFEILPFLYLGKLSCSVPNNVSSFIFFMFLIWRLAKLLNRRETIYLAVLRWKSLMEGLCLNGIKIVKDSNRANAVSHMPFIFMFFFFVSLSNLYGLAPYTFTLTSHLILTFVIAFTIFLVMLSLSISIKGKRVFLDFLPQNTSLGLAFLLVPIEVVSVVFKPLSLSVRLFANMIAGHTLLKVICGFAWAIISAGGFSFFFYFVPLLILVLLIGLELGVALIQAYVFTILISIYLRESTEAQAH